jgi:hypothetical protein
MQTTTQTAGTNSATADVLTRTEYERLYQTVDTALASYKTHQGQLSALDQEVFIELRSLRMWLSSILRVPSRGDSERAAFPLPTSAAAHRD